MSDKLRAAAENPPSAAVRMNALISAGTADFRRIVTNLVTPDRIVRRAAPDLVCTRLTLRRIATKACRVVAFLTAFAVPLPGLTQAIYEFEMTRSSTMPQYLIERDLPGAGKLSAAELQAISCKSNGVLRKMGAEIQWLQSYVTGDKIYCVYRAESEDAIRRHAQSGGFPANKISRVVTTIDPTPGR
ncbi:MAG: DUF4242 domain-containing protein [Burkholderiales bacterium]